jgi:hypothetical protein
MVITKEKLEKRIGQLNQAFQDAQRQALEISGAIKELELMRNFVDMEEKQGPTGLLNKEIDMSTGEHGDGIDKKNEPTAGDQIEIIKDEKKNVKKK